MKRAKKLLVLVAVIGLAGGSGFVSGVAGWLAGNPAAAVVLGIIAWLAFAYVSPYRTCRWCRKRRNGKRWPCRRRCWRCKNTRETRRLGAYRVHKVKDSLIRAWDERGEEK